MLHVLGIRHHGPGSAKTLRKALRHIVPDCILIEMPADAEAALPFIANDELTPPTALLVYNPKDFQQASYLPFAKFSPEWQAFKYAYSRQIPIIPMDLPIGILLGGSIAQKGKEELFEEKKDADRQQMVSDPLGYIGALAGYSDGERWWEATFEQRDNDLEIFETILSLMTALREELDRPESRETLVREAFMRKKIRAAFKAGHEKVVVVCGAWHSPVLENWEAHTQKADNALLKGLKKVKTKATWVPWSYEQLAIQGGYGAGVKSPAWYELLFSNRKDAVIRWMSKVARLLRSESIDASPAHVLEASRLAETLAVLRKKGIPGLEEMEESVIAVFCQGDHLLLDLIRSRLVVGSTIGKVGASIPQIPLLIDLEKQIKSARLSREWKTTDSVQKDLDLRKPANLAASQLIHQLNVLGIKWGRRRKGSQFKTGSFHEHWTLKRRTDFAIKLVEAARWGNRVSEAAEKRAIHEGLNKDDLPALSSLIEDVLSAQLLTAIPLLTKRLQDLAATTKDLSQLLRALPQLVHIVKYGNTRQTDVDAVWQILQQIIPRLFVGLPNSCMQVDEDLALERYQQLLALNQSLSLLNDDGFSQGWTETLEKIAGSSAVSPLLNGLTWRLLFDKGNISVAGTARQLEKALSPGQQELDKASWLEGFLSGSGLLLIHHQALWNIIDDWITGLSMDAFQQIVPLLRRTFSTFSDGERRKMLSLAKEGHKVQTASDWIPEWTEEQQPLLNTLQVLLGFKE